MPSENKQEDPFRRAFWLALHTASSVWAHVKRSVYLLIVACGPALNLSSVKLPDHDRVSGRDPCMRLSRQRSVLSGHSAKSWPLAYKRTGAVHLRGIQFSSALSWLWHLHGDAAFSLINDTEEIITSSFGTMFDWNNRSSNFSMPPKKIFLDDNTL